MSVTSFDNLLELIKEEITADANAIRYGISPEEKLIVTAPAQANATKRALQLNGYMPILYVSRRALTRYLAFFSVERALPSVQSIVNVCIQSARVQRSPSELSLRGDAVAVQI
jgi:hypothetical protein